MGHYRLWLQHRVIRWQMRNHIDGLEQERARVQPMAPA